MYGNYNPYLAQNPYMPLQRHEVIKVNGEGGANAFQMAPNSSVLLLDESAPIIWLKTTDGAGYPTLTPYSITPYVKQEPEDLFKTLDERIKKLEELVNESNHAAAKSKRTESAG